MDRRENTHYKSLLEETSALLSQYQHDRRTLVLESIAFLIAVHVVFFVVKTMYASKDGD